MFRTFVMALLAMVAAMSLACEGDTIVLQQGLGRGIVIVNTDFTDTTVSLLDRLDRSVVAPEIVSSAGTAGLSSPLSGDVVPVRAPNPFGDLVLMDRQNGNLTLVDPITGEIVAQHSLRSQPGDPRPNPSDAVVWSADKVYVSRQGRCVGAAPDPFNICDVDPAAPTAFDNERSNDLIVLDLVSGAITDPAAFDFNAVFGATGTGDVDTAAGDFARPGQIVSTGRYLAVTLLNLDAFFDGTGGTGLIALIDPASDTIADATPASSAGTMDPVVLDAGGGAVCEAPGKGAAFVASQNAIYIACNGISRLTTPTQDGDYAARLAASRLLKVDLSALPTGDVVVSEVLSQSDLQTVASNENPLSGRVEIVSATLGFVTTEGAFPDFTGIDTTAPASTLNQGLYSFNPTTGAVNVTPLVSEGPFSFTGLLADPLTGTLYLSDAPFGAAASVRVFDLDATLSGALAGAAIEDAAAAFVPNTRPGQAPGEMAFY